MSDQPTITMQSLLRGLWREIDAEGGVPSNDHEQGFCEGIALACRKLEAAGFGYDASTAADLIDAIAMERDALRAALLAARKEISEESQSKGVSGPEIRSCALMQSVDAAIALGWDRS